MLKKQTKKIIKKSEPEGPPPKVLGKRDPLFPGIMLVKVGRQPKHSAFPKVDTRMVFPETYYKWNPKKNVADALVTRCGKTWIAWMNCGRCHHWWKICRCNSGVASPRSIEYIYDHEAALSRGEEWTVSHPDYQGTLTRADREARMNAKPIWVSASTFAAEHPPKTARKRPYDEPEAPTPRGTGKKPLRKAQVAPETPANRPVERKRMLTKRNTSDAVLTDSGEVDLGALDEQAVKEAEAMMADFDRVLDSTPAKKIRRRAT